MTSNKRFGIFAACAVAAVVAIALVNLYEARHSLPPPKEISYSQFLDDLEQDRIRTVTLTGQEIAGYFKDRTRFITYAANDPDLVKALRQKNVDIIAEPVPQGTSTFVGLLKSLLPLILLIVLFIYFMNRMSRPGGRAMSLGKSKAKMLPQDVARVTFEDVAGVDEAKEDLQEIVDFLRDPSKFKALGGRIPHGVLMVGPPGTGKTLLARAIAGEANVPFFTISGSDFVEMFVGIGASRVRDMFDQAKKHAPCIIFMDEIDAVGRKRGAGLGGGNDEREQTLNQLLVEMDGFAANDGVILIAATNRPDVLDPALLRPGRFDREIVVDKPDVTGRERILGVHVRKVPLAPDVDLKLIARSSSGFSGADLMNLVNEAALLAVRRGKQEVGMREFDDAKDRVTMGAERRTQAMTDEEKRLTAYREGGRVVVALHVPAADPVHKATIIPRGRTMGTVKQIPQKDQRAETFEQMTSRLAIILGGRAAEEMVFGRKKVTSATANDIEEATKLARTMITRWGFSETLGVVAYGENQDEVFLGHSVARQQNVSEETAQAIALEVRKLIDESLAEAQRILTEHRDELEVLARGLLEYETLSGEDIRNLLAGRAPLPEPETTADAEAASPARRGSLPRGHAGHPDGSDDGPAMTNSPENRAVNVR